MRRPANCNCHCEEEPPNCFECHGQTINVGDALCSIGDTLTWDKPLYQTCSIPLKVWSYGGLNCDIWGLESGLPCEGLISEGGTAIKFHSVDVGPFGGSNILQRNPAGLCIWRKRHVKMLQQVWHDAATTFTPEGAVDAAIPSAHEDIITYPYVDPVDPADQWSPVVYPATATSPSYHLPVVDERCYTSFGPWPATGPGRGPVWECSNSSIANVLSLSIVRLGPSGYPDHSPDDLVYSNTGARYWELKLIGPQTYAANTTLVTTGEALLPGMMTGSVTPYGGRISGGAILDPRNPAVDLSACPPYYKITADSYCSYGPSVNQLFSGYDSTILRWIKPVDCEADFEGDPLTLSLAVPRAYDELNYYRCSNKHINAEKFGLTGYSNTAVVELIHE